VLQQLKILRRQGRQTIPNVSEVHLHRNFRGRPVISNAVVEQSAVAELCPVAAIDTAPLRIDLCKCTFCGLCARAFPEKIRFTNDYRLASNDREHLLITEGHDRTVTLNFDKRRPEIKDLFKKSLKLRQVSAGGDNSTEMELNACSNVNFDMGRFGIEFVASPRHADGIVVTGPVSGNMAEALQICYDAVPEPKILVLAGVDALSGGIFAGSKALDRSFLDNNPVDLYIPGNPPHPLTIINGLLDLCQKK
jgi:Ni,Fe-hydrogenase III small subunit